MQATIVSDTSCLILLDEIGELHLLRKLFDQVVITQIVAAEYGNELPDWIIGMLSLDWTIRSRVIKESVSTGLDYSQCYLFPA